MIPYARVALAQTGGEGMFGKVGAGNARSPMVTGLHLGVASSSPTELYPGAATGSVRS